MRLTRIVNFQLLISKGLCSEPLLLLLLVTSALCVMGPRCHVDASSNATSPEPTKPVSRCDLNAGRWVRNPWVKRYTGYSCQSIRSQLNCDRKGRQDSEYLNYEWRSPGCNIKRFNTAAFLSKVRNRVFMTAGDSYATNLYHALRCLIETTTPVQDYSTSSAFGTGVKASGFTVPSHSFTFLRQSTNFLVDSEPQGTASSKGVWTVYLGRADPKWAKLLPHVNYVLFATGHWFTNAASSNRDYRGYNGSPISVNSITAMRAAIRTVRRTIQAIGFRGMPMALTYTATHYGKSFPPEDPMSDCSTAQAPVGDKVAEYAAKNTFFMQARNGLVRELRNPRFKIIDITRATLYRPDAHLQKYGEESMDCSHWCVPGVPDSWADIVYSYVSGSIT
ncbi:hypothetical protein CLOM_g15380 [Closterium sp. NIES-68]|nr:hypothetical protein CLOM_g15380 [Closterium sp. NIES-68]